jgi:Domain of unknown function (DUF4129)
VPQRSTQSRAVLLGWVLPVVVAVLLVVTTVALAVSNDAELSSQRLDTPDLGLAIGLLVAAATIIGLILWIVLLVTGENAKGAPPKRRKGRFASQLAILVIALVVLYLYRKRDHGQITAPTFPLANAPPGGATGTATPIPAPASGGGGFVLLFVLGSVLVAAILAAVILARQARRVDWDEEVAEPDAAADLSAALSAAERASYRDDDPRLVIIGCYEALEGVLARRGLSRSQSETASAVLASADRAGLLSRAGAVDAEGLVEIFERARFSPHEMTSRDVDRARSHLAALQDDIAAHRRADEADENTPESAVKAHGPGPAG